MKPQTLFFYSPTQIWHSYPFEHLTLGKEVCFLNAKVISLAACHSSLRSCIHPAVSDLSSSFHLAVFYHRETGTEASHDRGLYHNGYLQYRNHINSHFTGMCLCVPL